MPASQLEHMGEPCGDVSPKEHMVQLAAPVNPAYCPTAQLAQLLAPEEDTKVPTAQLAQSAARAAEY